VNNEEADTIEIGVVVEARSLITRHSALSASRHPSEQPQHVKNFKRFKKVISELLAIVLLGFCVF